MQTTHGMTRLRAHSLRLALVGGIALGALALPADAVAQRKGFIIGLGAGAGSFSVSPAGGGPSQSKTAFATDFKIGWAFSDRAMVYYSADGAFFGDEPDSDILLNVSGLVGLGVTYFLRPASRSLFVGGALGYSSWASVTEDGEVERLGGAGFALSGGFEFARHFLIDADLVFGRPSDSLGDVRTRTLRLAVNWLYY